MSSTNSVAAATMALRFKEYIANMPDAFDTKKEIDEYIKVGLNNIVKEMKAAEKMDVDKKRPMKKAKKNDDTKMDDADTVNAAKAEKEAEKAKKAAEKEAEKAKKAAEKEAEKAKKAVEKEAEKAKKAVEKEAEKAKKSDSDDDTDEDYVPPKRRSAKKEKKEKVEKSDSDTDDAKPDEEKPKKRPAKKEKKEKVEKSDSDTDDAKSDEEKPKKPPTERKIFFDEMRIKIKELFPDLNSQQTTKKITDLWKTKQDRERGIDTYY